MAAKKTTGKSKGLRKAKKLEAAKPLTKTKTLGEFLEYLQYFREAGGAICAPPAQHDAVRLLTAHGAKGLEWDHVFIIRANSGSFPSSSTERRSTSSSSSPFWPIEQGRELLVNMFSAESCDF